MMSSARIFLLPKLSQLPLTNNDNQPTPTEINIRGQKKKSIVKR